MRPRVREDGALFVGEDRYDFKVDRSGTRQVFATLPSSVAAFHLALAPTASIWVTAPTLSHIRPYI